MRQTALLPVVREKWLLDERAIFTLRIVGCMAKLEDRLVLLLRKPVKLGWAPGDVSTRPNLIGLGTLLVQCSVLRNPLASAGA